LFQFSGQLKTLFDQSIRNALKDSNRLDTAPRWYISLQFL